MVFTYNFNYIQLQCNILQSMKSPRTQNILTKIHAAAKSCQMLKCGKCVLTGVTHK